ncbi:MULTISPECIES: lysophospholipid acyltransferase family protein [unclassified Streptomyces]|uniref:1-acyl-sn-glycerol-3-phosphate acyltransferase n=1 Tax=unclassified Streptomyces TaxID=2593676 RepID=UPI0020345A92|nr:lysophospholipid acyltransferase family protein [Streptomyces sp. RKAG290]MCM2411506.1 1-acyl-sn-glycerol-3-phosphate acyltransferase [Streptomyces sp. RKAG290]
MTTLLRTPGRAVLPVRSRFAATLRRGLWWGVLSLTGGVERRGRLPRGGCVVVANHSSHADTAALLAALDARHTPAIGAAADYWFASPWRRRICRRLAAGFPVRRGGGGMDDLLSMAGELRAGRAVVLFPEGTRAEDGALGSFHRGALVLAEQAGVPVVPVGIAGTDRLLPKHGRLRSSLVRVSIGEPLPGKASPEQARDAVLSLHARTAAEPLRDSAARRRIASVVTSRWGVPLAFCWAFAEALSWPLMPELLLGAVCVAVPRAALKMSAGALAGSVAGGLLALQLASAGVQLPAPLTTDRMRAEVRRGLALEGASAVRHQPWNGIPFKVYGAGAGHAGVPAADWLVASATARGSRTLTVGLGFAAFGLLMRRHRRHYGRYLALLGGGFAVGLSLIVHGWS